MIKRKRYLVACVAVSLLFAAVACKKEDIVKEGTVKEDTVKEEIAIGE